MPAASHIPRLAVGRTALQRLAAACCLFLNLWTGQGYAQSPTLLDNMDVLDAWQVIASPGARASIHPDQGRDGQGLRIDFDFRQGGGEILLHKPFPMSLPDNFVLSFDGRAEGLPRGLELRLVDASGGNVWRFYDPRPALSQEWGPVTAKRRRFEFAWGPAGGGNPARLGLIEFMIPRGKDGHGSLWIDNLRLEARSPDRPYANVPKLTGSAGSPSPDLLNEAKTGLWRADESPSPPWLQLDFQEAREFGGLIIDWDADDFARSYLVELSNDGLNWRAAREVTQGNGERDFLPMPESESRFLRLRLLHSSRGHGFGIRHLSLQGLDFSTPPEHLFKRLAQETPAGYFPRYFGDQQTYWTLVGTPGRPAAGADCEALLSEDGTFEAHGARFTLEPFLRDKHGLHTWANGENRQSLEQGYLPIPSVRWKRSDLFLDVTAVARDQAQGCGISLRYRVTNGGRDAVKAQLFLTARPLPVPPPWQALTPEAALSPLHALRYTPGKLTMEEKSEVLIWPKPDAAGVADLDSEPLPAMLAHGHVPERQEVTDPMGFATAALRFDLSLAPGQSREAVVTLPAPGSRNGEQAESAADFKRHLGDSVRNWERELDRVELQLPSGDQELAWALKSNLAYILINRSGPAVRPGSRRYGRTWVRDGAVASAGLLALGHTAEARSFLDWFARYQNPDGSVPCCLDPWGPDAMIEHDSAGEFIYAAANYFDYSHDIEFLRGLWPKLALAAEYLERLRAQRLTPAFQQGEQARYFGLLPESASHEGYMAKPVHSYWDDFWALRGFADAARLATVLGDARASRFAAQHEALRKAVQNSIVLTQQKFSIDYVPGAADLGDFDPTSSAVAVTVAGEAEGPLRESLLRTFERFNAEINDRREGKSNWQGYAPYELRNVSALVRLGQRDAAYRALRWLFDGRRPPAWNQWPEVVWRDLRIPRFLGDMPHSWIGAEYIQALLSLFVYEDSQRRLVLGAGLPRSWLNAPGGVAIRGLKTPYGTLNYQVETGRTGLTTMRIEGGLPPPAGGLLVELPGLSETRQARLDGKPAEVRDGRLVVKRLPARIEIQGSAR